MTFLSDQTILACIDTGSIVVKPFVRENVQPASIDLTLDRFFKTIKSRHSGIDPREPISYDDCEADEFELGPYGFCLGSTVEWFEFPANMIGRLEGKSSLGRLGLTAHVTAGFFDPGFKGHATLELFNANNRSFKLYAGMKIAQMSFARLTTHARRPYGDASLKSKYQMQERGPHGSQYHRNYEGE